MVRHRLRAPTANGTPHTQNVVGGVHGRFVDKAAIMKVVVPAWKQSGARVVFHGDVAEDASADLCGKLARALLSMYPLVDAIAETAEAMFRATGQLAKSHET